MNSRADDLPLLLRVLDAREQVEEALLRLRRARAARGSARRTSRPPAPPRLAQQAVVDEHARELVADRLVHEQRGDGRVDAAGERRRARARSRPARGSARPAPRSPPQASTSGGASGDLVEEVLQHLHARAPCAPPRGGTGRRRAGAQAPRRRRSASTRSWRSRSPPSGGATTESRWLIHTVSSSARPSNSAPRARGAQSSELGDAGAVDAAAEILRHHRPGHRDTTLRVTVHDRRRRPHGQRRGALERFVRGPVQGPHDLVGTGSDWRSDAGTYRRQISFARDTG